MGGGFIIADNVDEPSRTDAAARPVSGAPVASGASGNLKRSFGTFQLTMFGVGATIGTGIFFVLAQAVPEAARA